MTLLHRMSIAAGAMALLLAGLVLGGTTATAAEQGDGKGQGGGSSVQVVWASSTGRTAQVDCPEGMVAVGGGVEGPTNTTASPVMGAPLSLPGRGQNPWMASSVPTGPGIPAPNEDFDFTTGVFRTPTGSADAPTGWYGQTTNSPGGTRVYAICTAG